jgi:dihydroorotate dehydrogenase electron transfer subunit
VTGQQTAPVQVRGEVLSVKRVGAYVLLALLAPSVASNTRPGHFAALAVGDDPSATLLRRAFSIYRAEDRGVYGGTLEIVFAIQGAGTAWLAHRRARDSVDVVAPLGRPFALPRDSTACVLVGGGYGSAPLLSLADALRERGCRVHAVLGAATEQRLFGALEMRRRSDSLAVTTEDGSTGHLGRVTDVLPTILTRTSSRVVYACGPMGMLANVTAVAAGAGAVVQTAVEESMACGIGVCMTCVLPVVGDDGRTRMVRSCVDGPVFRGDRVRWSDVGTVPADTVGAAT